MANELKTYRALVVCEKDKGTYSREVKALDFAQLPVNEVLVKVHYSSLNYKDALSASGNRGVTRRYPHVPGIDAVGVVVKSPSPAFSAGDRVIASGFDLGMNHAGGFAQYLTAPADWLVPLPEAMSFKESMIWGTAGFTAAQCVARLLENGASPGRGKILVTGASGGVGSVSVAILAKLGFEVVAVTGKDAGQFLQGLGAADILTRDGFVEDNVKLLLKEKWAGVVDTVGGRYLETAIRQSCYGTTVTCCGNVASADLHFSVYPFILRGVTLVGIDSAQCPVYRRIELWQKMAGEWALDQLADLATVITLDELEEKIDEMLAGKVRGRIVVKIM
ncbi:MAG: YhdH/YhfP family quinone oxidoreductase [Proteobacteria bacterium]|nr:YhdH/YhfP family quinone oxidoreductase [Pseudomonadota bacterium]MBU1232669.1 YhdH/YhfP family quinone oxidoreductase [Pseudomonadota bacterium]MBU1418876.1 YhdH/YhfP family quinone oxidoreductase [Pseudomonadota bacterium]MBU1455700.1 YhdH/YhfP family quinone oxidoreductase [Pseudomonadota bacterium]